MKANNLKYYLLLYLNLAVAIYSAAKYRENTHKQTWLSA